MISVLLLFGLFQVLCLEITNSEIQRENSSMKSVNMLQLSDNDSGVNNSGFDDDSRILTIFLLNIIGCALCCAFIQAVIIFSKKLNAHMINLRKNYKKHKSLLKFKEFRETYGVSRSEEEKEVEP